MIGTQVMVVATGTNEFCGGACHSMQWVAASTRPAATRSTGPACRRAATIATFRTTTPRLLWYKAKAGIKDVIGEMRGVIDTEEKFKKERARMAEHVWAEYKANNPPIAGPATRSLVRSSAKQKDFVRPMHEQFLAGQMTCIDCHKGIAHKLPE